MSETPVPGPTGASHDRWRTLFLPQARPLRPEDLLLARPRAKLPPAWLVLLLVVVDAAVFAYVYAHI